MTTVRWAPAAPSALAGLASTRTRALPRRRPLLAPGPARLIGLLLLGGWGAGQWSRLVAPAAPFAVLAMFGLAVALAAAIVRVPPGRRRRVAAGVAGVVFLAAVVVLAGAPTRLLAPSGWGGLASGVGQGLQALPGAATPYAGADGWARIVMLAGGGLLLGGGVLATALVTGGGAGSRVAAAVPLLVVAAVPGIVLVDRAGVLSGVALFAALAAFLWLERLRRAEATGALALTVVAGALGLAGAGALDQARPWIDYESLALRLSDHHPARFDWTHRYGPMDWARDGREVLRVQMKRPVYLKAEDLDAFDGVRWHQATVTGGIDRRAELPSPGVVHRWSQTLRITDRGLASFELVGAGVVLAHTQTPSHVYANGSPGTFALARALRPGDAYRVRAYSPDPKPAELALTGREYPESLDPYLILSLPERSGAETDVQFAFWGEGHQPSVLMPDGSVQRNAGAVAHSDYGRAYRLARRLATASTSPYDYVRRVRTYLGARNGFRYDENAPRTRFPLEHFLFIDRRGYCQHFSGAMALLLRMGGIPARVATGFTPGGYDRLRHEWVVRDYDAHSWVEAWFPGIGWTTFDPTPTAAPALLGGSTGHTIATVGERVTPHQRGQHRKLPAVARAGQGGGVSPWAVGFGVVAALGLVALVVWWRRRGERPSTAVAELELALRRCGRSPAPELTLRQLERRLRGAPDAAAYVRAVREAAYGYGSTATPAQRRALRHELGRGLGVLGRARALWALPPRRV